MGCCYDTSRDQGCGCSGCLVFLIILAIVLGALAVILGLIFQVFVGFVGVLLGILSIFAALAAAVILVAPAFGAVFYAVRSFVLAFRDAIRDNHYYRKPTAALPKRILCRAGGFIKDLFVGYFQHVVDTVKNQYAESKNRSLRFVFRAWHFLVMIHLPYHGFVGPLVLVFFLVRYGCYIDDLFVNLIAFFDRLIARLAG